MAPATSLAEPPAARRREESCAYRQRATALRRRRRCRRQARAHRPYDGCPEENAYYHCVEELLRKGADVNRKDGKKRNVLHNLAADEYCNRGSSVVEILLRANVAVNGPDGQDDTQRTPLHWAASTGKKELCGLPLTKSRGNRASLINAVEFKGKTALHLAAAHGRDDIVELLPCTCQQGSAKVVDMLLLAGADINAQGGRCDNALQAASKRGHEAIVKLLLNKGANVNAQGGEYSNAL